MKNRLYRVEILCMGETRWPPQGLACQQFTYIYLFTNCTAMYRVQCKPIVGVLILLFFSKVALPCILIGPEILWQPPFAPLQTHVYDYI